MANDVTKSTSGRRISLLELYLAKKAVLTLLPSLELYQFGREAIVPANGGREIFVPFWIDDFTAAGVLTEGTAVVTSDLVACSVSGMLSEYGMAAGFSRLLWQTKSLPILEEATKQLMQSLARGWEDRIQTAISATDTISALSWLAGDRTTAYNEVLATTMMKASVFSKAASMLASGNNPGYAEYGGRYAAVIHPISKDQLATNISANLHLQMTQQSMNQTGIFRNNVIGDLFGCRIFESPYSAKSIADASGGMSDKTDATGFLSYVFAPEAFFVAPLANARPEIILHGFGSAGSSDPTNTLSTLAAYGVFDAFTYVLGSDRAKRMIWIASGNSQATDG